MILHSFVGHYLDTALRVEWLLPILKILGSNAVHQVHLIDQT